MAFHKTNAELLKRAGEIIEGLHDVEYENKHLRGAHPIPDDLTSVMGQLVREVATIKEPTRQQAKGCYVCERHFYCKLADRVERALTHSGHFLTPEAHVGVLRDLGASCQRWKDDHDGQPANGGTVGNG